jgi:hypothetical protein
MQDQQGSRPLTPMESPEMKQDFSEAGERMSAQPRFTGSRLKSQVSRKTLITD